ncbi:MAG: hypothetical protein JWR09_1142 [Mucilaginibacter sp.]|nr:hypothetical protein [Mucilaginibacter sp.]
MYLFIKIRIKSEKSESQQSPKDEKKEVRGPYAGKKAIRFLAIIAASFGLPDFSDFRTKKISNNIFNLSLNVYLCNPKIRVTKSEIIGKMP